jgi:hypothetical protein
MTRKKKRIERPAYIVNVSRFATEKFLRLKSSRAVALAPFLQRFKF